MCMLPMIVELKSFYFIFSVPFDKWQMKYLRIFSAIRFDCKCNFCECIANLEGQKIQRDRRVGGNVRSGVQAF